MWPKNFLFKLRGKVAVSEIRKKIFDSNPHVAKNALIVSNILNFHFVVSNWYITLYYYIIAK